MMYKILCFAFCLIFVGMHGARVYAEDSTPPEKAEILLVYDARNIEMSESDIEQFCIIASSMGKGLEFGDIADFKNSLDEYPYVICYRLEEINANEMRAVCDYKGGNLLILGSDFMKRYLNEIGRSDLILRESGLSRGVLHYSFSLGTSFEEIVDVENIMLFQTEDEGSGTITVDNQAYPFFSRIADVSFIPVTDFSVELVQAALMQELTDWMWPYGDTPPDYGQYLVFDSVYPFMDAEELLEKINVFIDEEIPYVLCVMPIYKNASYPAMVQFCQVLQYAQQNGGFIIIRAPIVHATSRDADELYEVLTEGLNAYYENGVYPMGIEVPVSWTYDDFYLDALRRYRTVFVYNDGESSGFEIDAGYNKLYYNYHQLVMPVIALDGTGASYLTCYSSAIYLDSFSTDVDQLGEMIEILKSQKAPFQNLWELEHTVWGNDLYLSYKNGRLYLNDELRELSFEPVEYDEDYDYNRDIIQRITVSLQDQNKFLIAITVIIVVMFVSFMIFMRRRNRRSFFYYDED